MLTHVDLFSGIGGFALAAGWAGFKTVAFCEIESFCQEVLKKHWPKVPIHKDIKTLHWTGEIPTLITGGFPCQPFSCASAGRIFGTNSDNYLWPQMFRVISEARPAWVLIENVPHFERLAGGEVVSDLACIGYEKPCFFEIPACAVGLHHRRSRPWICSHSNGDRKSGLPIYEEASGVRKRRGVSGGLGKTHGISGRMDRPRLKALGSAIVPQVAYEIIRAIAEIEGETS